MIEVKWLMGFEDLTDVHMIRQKVFIKEQGVHYEVEMDGTDADAIHLLLLEDNIPIGTGRIIIIDENYTLGRIAVLKEYRGKGYGKKIVEQLIRRTYRVGGEKQHIHAQLQVVSFYEKLGFTVYGSEFKEAGIRHIKMVRTGDI